MIGASFTQQAFYAKLSPLYFPLLTLLFAYLYFRGSVNDWRDRFVTAITWIALTLFFSMLLVQPVYGFPWRDYLSFETILSYWSPFAAVLIGGVMAHRKQII